ncbi:MAG: hypothetical protein PUG64_07540 [Bacteroidales bacterium]|nr:hypothetical protein [Bacteroidales bacterium]MDY3912198.1 hypothetical protein [Sodaliphilus sp.]
MAAMQLALGTLNSMAWVVGWAAHSSERMQDKGSGSKINNFSETIMRPVPAWPWAQPAVAATGPLRRRFSCTKLQNFLNMAQATAQLWPRRRKSTALITSSWFALQALFMHYRIIYLYYQMEGGKFYEMPVLGCIILPTPVFYDKE